MENSTNNMNANIKHMVAQLISGNTISIKDAETRKIIQKELREIKKNCTIVLQQLNENK